MAGKRPVRHPKPENMPEPHPPVEEQDLVEPQPAPSVTGSSILSRLYVVLFLAGVVLVECAIAYLYLPTRSETAAMAGVAPETGPEADWPAWPGVQPDGNLEDQMEVDLGQFSVTAFQPISGTALRIDFHLYGTIDADDEREFEETWQESTHRVRDQVIVTIRSAEPGELTDPGLGLIKRRILEKTNRTFGEPLLNTVVFSDFSFVEQ